MALIHRTADRNLQVTTANSHGYFDQCLFFVGGPELDDPEGILECAYTTNATAHHVFALDVSNDDFSYITAAGLEPDDIAEREIRKFFEKSWSVYMDEQEEWGKDRRSFDVWDILRGEEESFVDEDADASWNIQRIRAQLARRMGFLAVLDHDEQGEVYIVDFAERNDELNAKWVYVGEVGNA